MSDLDSVIEAASRDRQAGALTHAIERLEQAVRAAQAVETRRSLIRGLKLLGDMQREARQVELARSRYEEAVQLSRAEGDGPLLAHTVRHLGDLHRHAGRMQEAQQCYAEALALYEAASAPPALDFANALRPAALLSEAQGDSETARRLWLHARRLYEAAGVVAGMQECDTRLARL